MINNKFNLVLKKFMSKKSQFLMAILSIATTMTVTYFISRAGTLNPTMAPGDTMHTLDDIYCRITGCTPTAYGLDSPGAVGATMRSLEDIYDAVDTLASGIDYSLQKNQIWDDWKGSAVATSASLSLAYTATVDQNLEEGTWASTTDTNLTSTTVASGVVKRDERTGLYWSDCYSAAVDGTCDTRTNSFTLNGTVDDADDGLDAEGGLSVDFCEALALDADGDGTDETDWYLPSQKELIQVYINGAANNIPSPANNFWSSTELYTSTANAWYVYLAFGYTLNVGKTNNSYARCVRR